MKCKHESLIMDKGVGIIQCSDCGHPVEETFKVIDIVKARNDLFYFAKEVLGVKIDSFQKEDIKKIMKGKKIKLKIANGWKKV